MMTDFEKLVLELRTAQKAWYRYHDQQDLTRAKALERKVDAELAKKAAADTDPTPDLFAASNGGNTGNLSDQSDGSDGSDGAGADGAARASANLSDQSDGSDGSDGAGAGGLGWVPGGGAV